MDLLAVVHHGLPPCQRIRTGVDHARAARLRCSYGGDKRVPVAPVGRRKLGEELLAQHAKLAAEQAPVVGAFKHVPVVLLVDEAGLVFVDDMQMVQS